MFQSWNQIKTDFFLFIVYVSGLCVCVKDVAAMNHVILVKSVLPLFSNC